MDNFRDFNKTTEMLSAIVVQMADDINTELASSPVGLLRPLALPSIYITAQIHVQLCRQDLDPKYGYELRILLRTLDLFGQRWRVAGMLSQKVPLCVREAYVLSALHRASIMSALELHDIRI